MCSTCRSSRGRSLKDQIKGILWFLWINCFSQIKTQFINSWWLDAIKSNDSVILWNIDKSITTAITSKLWRFVSFICYEGYSINSSSTSELYLLYELSLWNCPNSCTTSWTSNCWSKLCGDSITQI